MTESVNKECMESGNPTSCVGEKHVKRTRKGAKKTKTGCFTCRVRHTKCDESKPSCKRCTDTGRTCDFLVPALAYTSKPKPPKRSLVAQRIAKSSGSTSSSDSDRPIVILPKIFPQPSFLPLMNSEEVRNFDYFRNVCADDLSGYFKVTMWEKIILQTAHQEPCIRHAVVALGSLHRSQLYPSGLWQTVTTLEYSTSYYEKAIKALNERLEDCSMSWELAILSSFIFLSLELLLGQEMNAVMHLKSAFRMLKAIRPRFSPSYNLEPPPATEAFSDLPLCPLSGNLHELASAFSRLDVQAAAYHSSYDPSNFRSRILPVRLTSLLHARDTLNSILSAMYSVLFQNHKLTDKTLPRVPLPPAVAAGIDNIKSHLVHWSTLFTSFTNEKEISVQDRPAANILIIQRITAWIHVSTYFYEDQLCYDIFHPRFARITDLAQEIVDTKAASTGSPVKINNRTRFSLDIGLIHPLNYVAVHCRDPVLRRRAIRIMAGLGREGVYDGASCAAVSTWIVNKEEEGLVPLENGVLFVPREKRLWDGVEMHFDRVKRKGHVIGIRRDKDGVWEHISGYVYWKIEDSQETLGTQKVVGFDVGGVLTRY